jgi:AcrR family transcriptional regulator
LKESQRQKQKTETRRHLIDVAIREFGLNGLTATRTSDIAVAAKVSHGTIFAHFPTREDLLDAVIDEFGTRITRRLHDLVGGEGGIKEALEAHLKGIEENEEFYIRLISEAPVLPESARNTLIMIQSAVSLHIIQAAEREMKSSAITDMPFDLLFNTWIGLIHYYLTNRDLFAPDDSVISKHGQRLTDHFMNLISCKER